MTLYWAVDFQQQRRRRLFVLKAEVASECVRCPLDHDVCLDRELWVMKEIRSAVTKYEALTICFCACVTCEEFIQTEKSHYRTLKIMQRVTISIAVEV